MVDVEAKKAKKGTPEDPHGHRFRQHNAVIRGKRMKIKAGGE